VTRDGLLVVNTSASWGGNEHWAVAVARGLAERGRPVRFVWSHDVVGERVAAAGLSGRRLILRADADLPALMALRDELLRARAGAVLLTRWREYLLGGLAARLAGRPRTVLRLGLSGVPRDDVKRRLIFRLADRVIVNAPDIRDDLLTRPWIDPSRVDVVINGLDLEAWQPCWSPARRGAAAAWRQAHGIAPSAPLVLTVGNLTGQKDHATLVAATDRLRDRLPDLRVVIAGEGGLRPALQADIERRGLAGAVTLAGFLPDPAAAMAAADLFVLSSVNEGMARVLVEAAATGLPAVTTDVSGARHCVEDGRTGRVVAVGDAAALADAMHDVLDLPADGRLAMGRRARALAEQRFALGRMLDETEAVLFGIRAGAGA
jgi:glycosyltransferase involved in cell wall biosynthesis